jgi:F-type H+-transporting ATPase subunit b
MTGETFRSHLVPRRAVAAAVAFAAWLAPLIVMAAEDGGEHHGNPWMDLVWKAVNVAALVIILWFFLRKPVGRALREASGRAKSNVDEARASAADMDKRYQDQRKNLENLKTELERMREEARAQTAAESRQLKKDAEDAASRMSGQIEKQVEQARIHALQTLRAELADEAVKLAEDLIKQKMDGDAQRRLLDQQIAEQERMS